MNNFKKFLYESLYLTIGCFITAFSVNYILKPNGLITSGITGLSIILEKYLLIDYYYIYYMATLIILIATLILMGKKEIMKIIFLSILYPTVLMLMQGIEFKFIENDLLLASIYFSLFYGIGVGMIRTILTKQWSQTNFYYFRQRRSILLKQKYNENYKSR